MKAKAVFYRCETCGNIVELIKNGGGKLVCCGKPMTKMEANTTDAAHEKHVPVVTKNEGKITIEVGSSPHPMEEKHFIEWVAVASDSGIERISLVPGEEPKVILSDKSNAEVYAYCNLHGLWKADI